VSNLSIEKRAEGMTEKRVNPELVLAAAKMAQPDVDWQKCWEGNEPHVFAKWSPLSSRTMNFDPRTSSANAHALMLALEREGWTFMYIKLSKDRGIYSAKRAGSEIIEDESPAMRLLKCVSAQSSIPLYLTNPGGEV